MRIFFYTLLSFFTLTPIFLQAQAPVISFQTLQSGLSSTVDIAHAGDGSNRLFLVEKAGTIRIWKNGALVTQPFINLSSVVLNNASERGLLSVAFHPAYAVNRYFFVYYTNSSGAITIARYRTSAVNPDSAELSTGVVLLNIPKTANNHNGGKLNFGPDGYLYFATGDGGGAGDVPNNAQNGNSLLGKMIRLNVNDFTSPPYYTIPADNPYTSDPAVRDEVWAIGLRNPWRWSFDRQTNDVWIADVGQGLWEEVNFRSLASSGGINYGWRCYEGNSGYNTAGCAAASAYIAPIFVYPHENATGGFSITGGYVYRGTEFPWLQGYYLCADYVSANGWLIKANGSGGWSVTQQTGWPAGLSGFGEAEDGTLYALTLGGTFYKVNATNPIPLQLLGFRAARGETGAILRWQTAQEVNTSRFEVAFGTDGRQFTTIGTVAALRNTGTGQYNYLHTTAPAGGNAYYRLKMIDADGTFSYSPIIRLEDSRTDKIGTVWPTLVTDGLIRVYPGPGMTAVAVFDAQGRRVLNTAVSNSNVQTLSAATLAKGVYTVRLQGGDGYRAVKVVVQ